MRGLNRLSFFAAAGVLALAGSASAQAIKISQAFGGGGNPGAPFNRDYVELFNAGATEVSLAGWSLQYATAAGSTWQSTALPASVIAPGGYFLVQVSSVGAVGEPLPQPDHIVSPGISMTSTSGKLALVDSTTALSGTCPTGTQIVDLVGFGISASCFEGSAPAPAPSNSVVLIRAGDGCSDLDDNATDFVIGPANPRNSSVVREVCPGADLAVTIEPDQEQLTLEHDGTYTVRIRNNGPDDATSIILTLTLPANASLIETYPHSIPIDGNLTFELGDLGVDAEDSVTLSLRPFTGTHCVLTAAATSPVPDAKPGNSTVVSTTPIFDFARAKLFVGVLDPNGEVRAVDVESGASRAILAASVSGLAADNNSRRFFLTDGINLTIVPWGTMTPVLVGPITGATHAIRGLAWHPGRRVLLGVGGANIYEIDLQTAAAKVMRTLGGGDLVGVDHEVSSNRLIATNNSAATIGGMSGRGFYRINPYTTELIFISAFPERTPGTPETDIGGCASGGGRIYGVTDQSQWIYRYVSATPGFISPLPQPLATEHLEVGSTFAPEFYVQSPGANLGIELATPRDCEAIGGQPMTMHLTVHNHGPSYAVAPVITVPLPTGATLVDSVPAVTLVDGNLTLSLSGLSVGESSSLTITLLPAESTTLALSATVAASTPDALPQNNTASRTIQTQSALPAAPAATAVLSSLPGSSSVPDREGLSFTDTAPFGRIFGSPSGTHWLLAASTSAVAATDRVLLRGSGESFEIVVQEGVTLLADIDEVVGDLGPTYSILESGEIALTTDTNTDPLSGSVAARSVSGQLEVIAEQGAGNLPMGQPYGATIGSLTLQSDGTATFAAQFPGSGPPTNALLMNNGSSILALTGTTIPTGQLASPVAIESFAIGTNDAQMTWMNAAGDKWCTRADLSGPATTDICLVVNNDVRIQEGFRIPGSSLTSNVTAIHTVQMDTGSGAVLCRGSNSDGKDWIWREGAVIATTGNPIGQALAERFADTTFARCFFLATGNSAGDIVIGGFTDSANANADEVLVLNNQHVLLRENDVIDIDGDGSPDDNARIHSFRENSAILTDDGWLYAVVRVRSGESVCLGAPTDIGQALIRKRVVCAADFNRDGGANVPDIFAFLAAWFAQDAAADFDGANGIGVPDIFSFLSAWFAGC